MYKPAGTLPRFIHHYAEDEMFGPGAGQDVELLAAPLQAALAYCVWCRAQNVVFGRHGPRSGWQLEQICLLWPGMQTQGNDLVLLLECLV